jgi:REP element-mobilizing transposase RayT
LERVCLANTGKTEEFLQRQKQALAGSYRKSFSSDEYFVGFLEYITKEKIKNEIKTC